MHQYPGLVGLCQIVGYVSHHQPMLYCPAGIDPPKGSHLVGTSWWVFELLGILVLLAMAFEWAWKGSNVNVYRAPFRKRSHTERGLSLLGHSSLGLPIGSAAHSAVVPAWPVESEALRSDESQRTEGSGTEERSDIGETNDFE